MNARRLAGIIRRYDGRLFPVYGTDYQGGYTHLHVQGAVVDFWATPRELTRRGWSLVMATPPIWGAWCMDLDVFTSCASTKMERAYRD
ncbi:hypothetical protein HHS34_005780 [Acidithiobacillus montserratensis]|uniref:Uncharacterized protein n=1 Tax=Acidithiobacillus montserratensis TaxID=2729135 RepID=A0ACD5HIJ7_9PROT|nr:hypothetical protein [Acidithiobacillus montserratensis]MBU2748625.1 hypothetical protein [Acidithiobacillus montserratensis]